jgi:diguanylate cyclase (GGDEF)-like protein
MIVGCSTAILHFEDSPDATITTADDAVWWAFATITKVGYGDRYPVSMRDASSRPYGRRWKRGATIPAIRPMTPIPPDGADAIRGMYRDRIVFALAIAGLVFILPFAVNNFLQGRLALGIPTAAVVLVLAVDALALWRKKKLPVPLPAMVLPIVVSLPMAIRSLGAVGMVWSYPSVLLLFFVLSRRMANVFAAAAVLMIAPVAVRYAGVPATIRFVFSLALVIVFSNIFLSIIEALHQRLAEQAVRDPLTGTYNRRHMEHLISAVVTAREAGTASLLIIDIDHFKAINDRLGHAAGDQVLRDVASVVAAHHPTAVVFRIGGEEFAMLLQGSDANAAVAVAEELRERIAEQRVVTVSIGVAELHAGDAADDWFKRADDALYEAKRGGRNRVSRATAVAAARTMPAVL